MFDSAYARAVLRVRNTVLGTWYLLGIGIFVGIAAGVGPPSALVAVAAAVVLAALVLPVWWFRRLALPESPTVPLEPHDAPELYLLVRQLATQLDVTAPERIELSPDCDAWLEPRATRAALIIGTPFLWWLRVTELRGLLAPVIAGMAVLDNPRVRSARGFTLRLDGLRAQLDERAGHGPLARLEARAVEWLAAGCHPRSEAMERAIAAHATGLAQPVEPAGRIVAHEQVGLIASSWDRVMNRLAAPAWQAGFLPLALNVALVEALGELGHRDKLSRELSLRLAERPACDLLEEPGRVDAAASVLAAAVFAGRHEGTPIEWQRYVPLVVEPDRRALAGAAVARRALEPVVTALVKGGYPIARRADAGVSEDTSAWTSDVVQAAGVALVECALVDHGDATWQVDWLEGTILRAPDGTRRTVHDLVRRTLETGDPAVLWSGLR